MVTPRVSEDGNPTRKRGETCPRRGLADASGYHNTLATITSNIKTVKRVSAVLSHRKKLLLVVTHIRNGTERVRAKVP
jgi:hypothetical protein